MSFATSRRFHWGFPRIAATRLERRKLGRQRIAVEQLEQRVVLDASITISSLSGPGTPNLLDFDGDSLGSNLTVSFASNASGGTYTFSDPGHNINVSNVVSGVTVTGSGTTSVTVTNLSGSPSTASLSINGHGGDADTFNVQSLNDSTSLDELGSGSPTYNLGNSTNGVQSINASVSLSTSVGFAAVTVDDAHDTTAKPAIAISDSSISASISGLLPSTFSISYVSGDIATLTVDGGSGGNTFGVNIDGLEPYTTTINDGAGAVNTINVLAANGPLNIHGQGGSDTVNVGSGGSLSGISGNVFVDNAGGVSSIDVDDSSDSGAVAFTLSGTATHGVLNGFPGGSIAYNPTSLGQTNPALAPLTILSGSGDDSLTVDFSAGNPVPQITGQNGVFYQGSGGPNTLNLMGGSFTDEQYDANGTGAGLVSFDTTSTIGFSGLQPINDIVPVTNYSFIAGNVAASQVIDIVDGPIFQTVQTATIKDGSGSLPSAFELVNYANKTNVSVADSFSTVGQTFNVNNALKAAGQTSLAVNTEASTNALSDVVNVLTTPVPLTIGSVNGTNTVNIGNSGNLAGIGGDVSITNVGGTTAIVIDGSSDTTALPDVEITDDGTTGTITGLLPGSGTITYENSAVASLSVATGSGGNTIEYSVTGTNTYPASIFSGSGDDTVTVIGTSGSLFVDGQGGHDTFNVGDTDAGCRTTMTINGDVLLDDTAGSAAISINDQDDMNAKTADFDIDQSTGRASVTGLAVGTISFQVTAANQFTINGGDGGNTFTYHTTVPAIPNILNSGGGSDVVNVRATQGPIAIDGQGGEDVVNLGSAGSLADLAGNISIANTGGATSLVLDDTNGTASPAATLAGSATSSTLTGFALATITYTPSELSLLTLKAASIALGNSLTVDFTSGNPIPQGTGSTAGLSYQGTGAGTVLFLAGGNWNDETFDTTGTGAGVSVLDGTSRIAFSGLEPLTAGQVAVTDVVPTADFTYTTSQPDATVDIGDSNPPYHGTPLGSILDGFTPVAYANKGSVNVHAAPEGVSGNPVVNVNIGTPAQGLNLLTVTTDADNHIVNLLSSPVAVNITGGGGTDTINIGNSGSLVGITKDVQIRNDGGQDVVTVDDSDDLSNITGVLNGGTDVSTLTGYSQGTISYAASGLSQLRINSGTAVNTLTVNFSIANPIPQSSGLGLLYTGSGTSDTLNLMGGSFATESYSASGAGAGIIAFGGTSKIGFSGLQPINDIVSAGTYTFNAPTTGAQTVNISDGPVYQGTTTATIASGSAPSGFELVNYGNKGTVIVNVGGTSDLFGQTVNVDNTVRAVGETALSINTDAGSDVVTVTNAPVGIGLAINTFGGDDEIDVDLAGVGSALAVNGGTGSNTLNVDNLNVTGTVAITASTVSVGSQAIGIANLAAINFADVTEQFVTTVSKTITVQNNTPINNQVIASFTNAFPYVLPGQHFTASINWGDSTSSTGQVVVNSAGTGFDVVGSHAYPSGTNTYHIVVTVQTSLNNGGTVNLNGVLVTATSFVNSASTQINSTANVGGSLIVTNVNDSGTGSLRAVLAEAALLGGGTIIFQIQPGNAPFVISLLSPLSVTVPVVIDARSTSTGAPTVELDGSSASSPASGGAPGLLVIEAQNCIIQGLAVTGYTHGYGVVLDTKSGSDLLTNDDLGTDTTGTIARGNDMGGLLVLSAHNTIGLPGQGNVISANGTGLVLSGSGATGNTIYGNKIGTDITGTKPLGNAIDGIDLDGAGGNQIGGSGAGQANIVAANGPHGAASTVNGGAGIYLFNGSSQNVIQGNQLGGGSGLDNFSGGLLVAGSSNNLIGGSNAGEGNMIGGNAGAGVILFSGATGNTVAGNTITGNAFDGVYIFEASNNIIGIAGAGNTITGNKLDGVNIASTAGSALSLASGNVVQFNTISTNRSDGVLIFTASGNLIGGPGAGNVIQANGLSGVDIVKADANTVQGNTISGQPNGYGVVIQNGVKNVIGGSGDSANTIFNNGFGEVQVVVNGQRPTGNPAAGNIIGRNVNAAGQSVNVSRLKGHKAALQHHVSHFKPHVKVTHGHHPAGPQRSHAPRKHH